MSLGFPRRGLTAVRSQTTFDRMMVSNSVWYIRLLGSVAFVAAILTPTAELGAEPQITVNSANTYWGVVDYSPDGSLIGLAQGSTASLFDVESRRRLRDIRPGATDVRALAFTPDSSGLVLGNRSGDLVLADVASGDERWSHAFGEVSVHSLDISPDGRFVLVSTWSADEEQEIRGRVHFLEAETGEILWTLDGGYPPSDTGNVRFLPNGRRAVLRWSASSVALLDLVSRRVLAEFDGSWGSIGNLAVSPDGTFLATSGAYVTITIREIATGEVVQELDGGDWVYSLTYSPDGSTLIAGTRSAGTRIFNLETDELIGTIPRSSLSVEFSRDGRRIAIGSGDGAEIWNWQTQERLQTFNAGVPSPTEAVLSPDGRRLFLGSEDSTVQVWDTRTMRLVGTLEGHTTQPERRSPGVWGIDVSPDGSEVATAGQDGTVRFWDARTLEPREVLEAHDSVVFDVRYSADGARIVTASWDETAVVWDRATLSGEATVTDEYGLQNALFVEAGESLDIITSSGLSSGAEMKRWDTQSAGVEIVYGQTHAMSPAFTPSEARLSPDGSYLLSVGVAAAYLFDAQTGNRIADLPRAPRADYRAGIFGPDGGSVYLGYHTGMVQEVDLLTNHVVRTLAAHRRHVDTIRFSPDGSIMYTASGEGTLRSWLVEEFRLLTTSIATPDGEWVTWTPEGFFVGTDAAIRDLVYVVDGLAIYEVDQLFNRFYRPDLVAQAAQGLDVSAVAGRTLQDGVDRPPQVTVATEHFDGEFRGLTVSGQYEPRIVDGTVRVRVTATDQGGGISELRLFHNGGRVPSGGSATRTHADGVTEQIFAVRLADGENRITAVALSADDTESEPAGVTLSYDAPERTPPAMWVLGIGVNEYRNPRYSLNYAVSDAERFTAALGDHTSSLFASVNTTLLTNEEGSRERILRAFEELGGSAQPQDVFVFFYAGHGIAAPGSGTGDTEFYFVLPEVTQMTSSEQLDAGGISGAEFQELVSTVPARKQLLILDACNSGAIAEAFGFGVRGAAEEFALSRLSRATGSALIAAGREDQFAQEFATLGQGALTHVLLEGLAGGAAADGREVTVSSLKRHVEYTLPLVTAEHAARPQYSTGFLFGEDFPLGVLQ